MNSCAGQPLLQLSLGIAPEAEDAIVELFHEVIGAPPSVYTDTQKHTTRVVVYAESISEEMRSALRAGLRRIRAAGLATGPGRFSFRRIRRENWAESWKRHFKPLEISERLLVLPSWSRRRPSRGQALVILDPGLSFGTGHHPTTAFCLEQVAALRDATRNQSMLDIGCGSGILAIAAAKLGYAPVVAFDFDPEAVRVARDNAVVNQVEFAISQQDLTKLPRKPREKFDVVCANLIYDLLIQERDRILARLSRQGMLVLAGILKEQFPKVRRSFEDAGLELVASRASKEWRSGAFRRSSS